MCNHGPAAVTMKILCSSLDITAATMHRHFADIEELFGRILLRHAQGLLDAISKVQFDSPDRGPLQRAAYLAGTRTGWGSHTDIHHLLLNYAVTLPPDMARPVESIRRTIAGTLVGPDAPSAAMALLDSTDMEAPEIEVVLAAILAAAGLAEGRRAAAAQEKMKHLAAPPEAPPPIPAMAESNPIGPPLIDQPLACFERPNPLRNLQGEAHARGRQLKTAGPFQKFGPSLLEAVFEARAGPP